jgi:hypothetical protein
MHRPSPETPRPGGGGRGALPLLTALALLAVSSPAQADIANFDFAGQIFTKWLYRNNDSQGVLTYGNPFWPENYSGDNGVASEFELRVIAKVSDFVEADVRLKSRYGATWHDFFENGNIRYENPNNSGESLGLDHAEYFKLRGYRVLIRPPYEWIDQVSIGSTDLGMFNPWSIGKIRFIDRDNTKAILLNGEVLDGDLAWTAGAVALPKLWGGPGWTTGLGDSVLEQPLFTRDWAYAARLDVDFDDVQVVLVGTTTLDYEIDRADPDANGAYTPSCQDALGNPIPGCRRDNAVDLNERYSNSVATVEVDIDAIDDVLVNVFGAFAASRIDDRYAANGVADNAGVFPMPFKDTNDFAGRARVELSEPFALDDFSLRAEYFYIGEDYVSHFAARREADVLLTDGFIEGGQLPTLNIANEFQDFDEPFFESIIGWHGGTLLLEQLFDVMELKVEQTAITYNTNAQDRDVDQVYPDFLHTDGYTDTLLYDYANVQDRGRDPRSVYRENQDRLSLISVLNVGVPVEGLWGSRFDMKLKYIRDTDGRDLDRGDDDYVGDLMTGRLSWTLPVNDELTSVLGGQADLWMEAARSGNPSAGYQDYETTRLVGFWKLSWVFGGVQLAWHLEGILKDQARETSEDQRWEVIRSKATMSVAF